MLVARSRDTSEVRLVPATAPDATPLAGRAAGAGARVLRRPPARSGRRPVGAPDRPRRPRVPRRDGAAVGAGGAGASGPSCCRTTRRCGSREPTCSASTSWCPSATTGALRIRVLDRAGSDRDVVVRAGCGRARWCASVATTSRTSRSVRLVREGWVRPPADRRPRPRDRRARRSCTSRPCAGRWTATAARSSHAVADDGVSGADHGGPARRRCRPVRRPCLLYGYGAYESSLDPEFWPEMLPLLGPWRGARLRARARRRRAAAATGGSRDACCRKRTTFTDFVACARHLVATRGNHRRPARCARPERRRAAAWGPSRTWLPRTSR